MKKKIGRFLRGDKCFEFGFSIEKNPYNTFPLHIMLIVLLICWACIQEEWNVISLLCITFVSADFSLISFRLGYHDMKRLAKNRIEVSKIYE